LNIKIKISKKLVLRIALFAVVIGLATIFDIYFESNRNDLDEIQTDSKQPAHEHGTIYLFNQANTFNAKTSFQKTSGRKIFVHSHDKYLQKHHQLRNFQVLKAEVQTQTSPLILSYHYLVFKNYFFTVPDDEPIIS
jgi:hypothetical protein